MGEVMGRRIDRAFILSMLASFLVCINAEPSDAQTQSQMCQTAPSGTITWYPDKGGEDIYLDKVIGKLKMTACDSTSNRQCKALLSFCYNSNGDCLNTGSKQCEVVIDNDNPQFSNPTCTITPPYPVESWYKNPMPWTTTCDITPYPNQTAVQPEVWVPLTTDHFPGSSGCKQIIDFNFKLTPGSSSHIQKFGPFYFSKGEIIYANWFQSAQGEISIVASGGKGGQVSDNFGTLQAGSDPLPHSGSYTVFITNLESNPTKIMLGTFLCDPGLTPR